MEKIKKELQEFREFVLRGNVLDLAVGVIIGGAFSKIVSSLVNDVLMPLIGILIGGVDFKNLTLTIGDAKITYGNFIQNVIDFLIIAACIFVIVKVINKAEIIAKANGLNSIDEILIKEAIANETENIETNQES